MHLMLHRAAHASLLRGGWAGPARMRMLAGRQTSSCIRLCGSRSAVLHSRAPHRVVHFLSPRARCPQCLDHSPYVDPSRRSRRRSVSSKSIGCSPCAFTALGRLGPETEIA